MKKSKFFFVLASLVLGSVNLLHAQWTPIGNPTTIMTTTNYVGIGTITPKSPLDIMVPNNSTCNGILYGSNPNLMGTTSGSFSPNLFSLSTLLDAYLGLHAYVYRK